jgi:hypothetical protein
MSIVTGVTAGFVIDIYWKLASLSLGHGFFTPLYIIASPIIGPDSANTAMVQPYTLSFEPGPAFLGLGIHMFWAVFYTVIFGLIVWASRLTNSGVVVWGLIYGGLTMLMMSFLVLPVLGISVMPDTIGRLHFALSHLVFGLILSLWPVFRPQDFIIPAGYRRTYRRGM